MVPKFGIGLRKFTFLSYPMTILYYTIGLYILKLTEQFIEDNKKDHIISYYGGNLSFQKDKLSITPSKIYFQNFYKSFKKDLEKEIDNNEGNRVIIRLDVQNYYENISIPILLNTIAAKVKPSVLKKCSFDETTIKQIVLYFKFLQYGEIGIPQGDNNIISNYVGWLYLFFGDLVIEDVIKNITEINSFKIIRYIDDIYISLEIDAPNKEDVISYFLDHISDLFYRDLKLRFNSKIGIYFLDNDNDQEELKQVLKKVSFDYMVSNNSKTSCEDTLNQILNLLDDIKESGIQNAYKSANIISTETLKDVYNRSVDNILKKTDNITRLELAFHDFNFNFFRISPKELILLLTRTQNAQQRFIEHFVSKNNLTVYDIHLIITYLCQTSFNEKKLLAKLKTSDHFKSIMEVFNKKAAIPSKCGYHDLTFSNIRGIKNQHQIIEQIRNRMFAEQIEEYSLSLNHLLNEVHGICCLLEKQDIKKYNSNNVITFLNLRNISNSTITEIKNLFDRRHNNTISHPGDQSNLAWPVSKKEYLKYRNVVSDVINRLMK